MITSLIVAHRALPDVEAMEALFSVEPLHALLPSLAIRTPQQQIQHWALQKQKRNSVQRLMRVFGKKITRAHTQQLIKMNVSFETPERWKSESKDRKEFTDTLKKRKINSKILRERLSLFFFKC